MRALLCFATYALVVASGVGIGGARANDEFRPGAMRLPNCHPTEFLASLPWAVLPDPSVDRPPFLKGLITERVLKAGLAGFYRFDGLMNANTGATHVPREAAGRSSREDYEGFLTLLLKESADHGGITDQLICDLVDEGILSIAVLKTRSGPILVIEGPFPDSHQRIAFLYSNGGPIAIVRWHAPGERLHLTAQRRAGTYVLTGWGGTSLVCLRPCQTRALGKVTELGIDWPDSPRVGRSENDAYAVMRARLWTMHLEARGAPSKTRSRTIEHDLVDELLANALNPFFLNGTYVPDEESRQFGKDLARLLEAHGVSGASRRLESLGIASK